MHATEEAPRTTSSWGLLSLYAGCKTDPGPLLEDEIALFSTLETPLANCHTTEYLPLSNDLKNGVCSLMPIIDPSHHEDPESDTSSGSGQSVSSVSTPAVPWEGESGTWDGNVSLEDCSHMPYASHMRMSEFRREQHRFNWETLSQAIVRKLYPHWPQAQAPQQIDSLYYLRHIGQGSSSSVYAAAFDGFGLNDTLAVKVLEDWRRNPTTGLPREFQIMQGLKHNHIVAFIGSFAQKHKFGVLMYPLAPYNLAQYLREVSDYNSDDRKLHQTRTKTLLTALGCLSSALFYLHVTQVIKHKDIKPENILVDRHGSMLLADFGISKKYQGDTATSGPTAFTEKYAAPEVAAQHKRDLSADVFSLGCVFLEMATVILGESLKTLDKEVFDGPGGDSWPKKAYRYCLPMVEIWMSHLKSISLREGSPWDGRPYSSPSESRVSQYEQTVGKCSLQERHLDIILAMMSECPYERPSMQDLYHVFTEFAADCFECHDSVSFQSEWHSGSVTDTWSLESTACSVGKKSSFKEQQLDIHHPRTNVPSAQVNPGVKRFRTGNPEDTAMIRKSKQVCGFTNHSAQQIIGQSDIEASKRQTSIASRGYVAKQCARPSVAKDLGSPQLVLDRHGADDDSSEAETYYSDCDDEDLVADSASEKKFAEGLFNSCGSGEFTANGSTSSGPPSKRRSIGQAKLVGLRLKGDHPDENDEEQDQDHEQDIEEKSDITSQSRKWFACQYFQHDRDRCPNRSCSGPGWFELHRLKEHLTRTHRIYSCDRCQESFRKSDDLKSHRRNVTPCELQDKVPDDDYDWGQGFNEDQASKLKMRIRKRQRTEASDKQKWEEWYRILFPKDSNIPSPYYNNDANSLMSELADNLLMNMRDRVEEYHWPLIDSCIQETVEDFTRQRLQLREGNSAQSLDSPANQNSSFAQTNNVQRSNPGRMFQNALHDRTVLQGRVFEPSQNFADFGLGNEFLHDQQLIRFQPNSHRNWTDDSACYTTFDTTDMLSQTGTTFLGDQATGVDHCVDPQQTFLVSGEDFPLSNELLHLSDEYLANPPGAEEQPNLFGPGLG